MRAHPGASTKRSANTRLRGCAEAQLQSNLRPLEPARPKLCWHRQPSRWRKSLDEPSNEQLDQPWHIGAVGSGQVKPTFGALSSGRHEHLKFDPLFNELRLDSDFNRGELEWVQGAAQSAFDLVDIHALFRPRAPQLNQTRQGHEAEREKRHLKPRGQLEAHTLKSGKESTRAARTLESRALPSDESAEKEGRIDLPLP